MKNISRKLKLKYISYFVVSLTIFALFTNCKDPELLITEVIENQEDPKGAIEYAAVFDKLKKGINQDATMPFSGSFPKVIHERAHMQAIREAGFESVRIFLPYSAGGYLEFESRIQDALDYNLAVVVCMWGNGTWSGDINTGTIQIAERWGAIANAWKSKFSNDVVFEILNEPKGIGFQDNATHHANAMKLYNAAVTAIRSKDTDRPILISSPGYNDSNKLDQWVNETHLSYTLSDGSGFFEDPNIGVAIHFYEPNNSNGWFAMNTGDLPGGDSWKVPIKEEIDYAVDWQEKYDTTMPVVVTEWGCWIFDRRTNNGQLQTWLNYTVDLFEEHNIGSMWYTGIQNNQRAFGIFDSELGWNQVVLDKLTGVAPGLVPSTSQIIDSEFISWGSQTWKLSATSGVTKSFVSGSNALSGSHSVKITVNGPTDCQMYQRTLIGNETNENIEEGRTLLHLLQGVTYEISFMAKAIGSEGQLKVMLKDNENLSTIFFESSDQVIKTTSETYTLSYTHSGSTAMDVRFEFDLGAKQQTLILDKAVFKRE